MFFPLKMIYFHSGFTTVGDLPGAGARKAKLQRSGSMGAITMHRSWVTDERRRFQHPRSAPEKPPLKNGHVAPSFALKQSEKIEVLMAEMEMEASVAAFPTLHGDNPSFFLFFHRYNNISMVSYGFSIDVLTSSPRCWVASSGRPGCWFVSLQTRRQASFQQLYPPVAAEVNSVPRGSFDLGFPDMFNILVAKHRENGWWFPGTFWLNSCWEIE